METVKWKQKNDLEWYILNLYEHVKKAFYNYISTAACNANSYYMLLVGASFSISTT